MSACDLLAWQAAHRARLHAALAGTLPAAEQHPARLHGAMRYATEGGKRLRALLVYAAGAAAFARVELLDAPAVAVELIHAFSLVHDDLPAMDNDDLRRGRPTLHRAFDEATAILAGDALQTAAFTAVASADASPELRLAWIQALANATGSLGMTGGQAVDLESEKRRLDLPQLEALHRLKTGALITASLRMGLAAGTPSAEVATAVETFAAAFGLAYQIQDDVLDVEGTAETLGKTPGKDLQAQKSTYVSLLGLDAAHARAEALFDTALSALPAGTHADPLRELCRGLRHRRH